MPCTTIFNTDGFEYAGGYSDKWKTQWNFNSRAPVSTTA